MMQRSKPIFVPLALLSLTTLAITGCGAASTDTTQPAEDQTNTPTTDNVDTPSSQGEATFTYGNSTYTADLNFCSLTENEDALFHGIVHDESGNEIGYLDGDFGVLDGNLHGEARIDFGATAQYESTDEFIAMGDAASNIVATDFSDSSWIVMGGGWNHDGAEQSNVMLKVIC